LLIALEARARTVADPFSFVAGTHTARRLINEVTADLRMVDPADAVFVVARDAFACAVTEAFSFVAGTHTAHRLIAEVTAS
jgi:hypothetical protein